MRSRLQGIKTKQRNESMSFCETLYKGNNNKIRVIFNNVFATSKVKERKSGAVLKRTNVSEAFIFKVSFVFTTLFAIFLNECFYAAW